jgi:hypothetical protein
MQRWGDGLARSRAENEQWGRSRCCLFWEEGIALDPSVDRRSQIMEPLYLPSAIRRL